MEARRLSLVSDEDGGAKAAPHGVEPAPNENALRKRVAELERALASIQAAIRLRAQQEAAVWKWTATPLGDTGKRHWRAICSLADEEGSSSLDLALSDLGPLIGKSERAGRRAYDGEDGSEHTGLKASGLVNEVERFRGRIKIELLDPLDVRRARLAIASLGQQEQASFLDALDAKPEIAPAGSLGVGGAAGMTSNPPASSPDSAGVAPYPPSVLTDSAGVAPNPPSPPIHSLRASEAQIHTHLHRIANDGDGARAPNGGYGATPAAKAAGAGLVGDVLRNAVERSTDQVVENARSRAQQLAVRIVNDVNDPAFSCLNEFAAALATSVEVDGDFPRFVVESLLTSVRTRQDGRRRIENPGGWFRASVRRRAAQIIRRTQDRRGNCGDAIHVLMETRRG